MERKYKTRNVPKTLRNKKILVGPVALYHEIWQAFEYYARELAKKEGKKPIVGEPIFYQDYWYMIENRLWRC